MDINHFNEFCILAKTCSYVAASEQLFISQSALSKHIKNFESELGHSLFIRTTRKIELTPFGKQFLPYAERIVAIQNEYTRDLLHNRLIDNDIITVGVVTPLLEHIFKTCVTAFQREYPDYQLNLIDSDVSKLKKRLIDKKCDIIIIHDSIETDSDLYEKVPIEIDYLAAALPPDHPLAGQDNISLSELKDSTFLFLPEGTIVYDLSLEGCRRAGFEPNIIFTSPSCENIFHFVERKQGVSIVAKRHLPPHDNIKLVDIDPPVATAVSLCYRKDNISNATTAFIETTTRIYKDKFEFPSDN
ncbi:MAG: LysR family transcriptional regulator [Oscillospiraceae bacterium]